MKKPKIPFLSNRLGVSYTISAVIMTVTAITLTIVASSYAYQILEQQRGATEFDVVGESILAFNDALENIAWKSQASRSARFTVNYGQLELMPNIPLTVNVADYPSASHPESTAYIEYSTSPKYVNFGEGYQSFFLGSNETLTEGAGSYGRASINQNLSSVYITLSYGVRVMKASTINVTQVNGTVLINNVDIWIIRISIPDSARGMNIGEFDLKAKCLNVTTETVGGSTGFYVNDTQCEITVNLGENLADTHIIDLDAGARVTFNFIVATVEVSV